MTDFVKPKVSTEIGENVQDLDALPDVREILTSLTELEKKYCEVLVMQKPKSKAEALQRAGSKADKKYLSKMAWELETRPHVQAYIQHLQNIVIQEAGLGIQEIINNARKGIEMAFQLGKPKEADPHNRLLAELGGFIKANGPGPSQTTQTKIEINAGRGGTLEGDFKRLQEIAGLPSISE